ncbi:glycoside hydrolase family 18 protein [Parathielavia hyrcaniae]|uniref:chitinase n=1 Tax=Parathielavia hyrcaniae TaxID=113614 RepID=A0AAN6PX13_9PEZI|nr:glycoside hydrolase family 18 protein [Parathielavia hyrcaniae]
MRLLVVLACLAAMVEAAGVLEIDLVFPRNETYAPRTWFPVVFALRNAHLAQHLRPRIGWTILNTTGPTRQRLAGREHVLYLTNGTTHEPYVVYDWPNLRWKGDEGHLELSWWADWVSCDLSGDEPAFQVNETPLMTLGIEFTIKSGGQAVDLVAATGNNNEGTCAQSGVAINVTDETRWVPHDSSDPWAYANADCAVLASSSPTPTANPCQVEINSAAAESITASMISDLCPYKAANDTTVDCSEDNAAGRLAVAGVACLAATFGALGYRTLRVLPVAKSDGETRLCVLPSNELGSDGLKCYVQGAAASTAAFNFGPHPPLRSVETCPERCIVSGPATGNWSLYPSIEGFRTCQETMFYDFSLYDPVDEPGPDHRVFACSSFGPDFSKTPASTTDLATATPVDVHFEIGWWKEGFGLAAPGLRSLIKQLRQYLDGGHGVRDGPFTLFGQSGSATIGLYIGQGLLKQGLSGSALSLLYDKLGNLHVSTPSLAMQLCGPGYDSTHIFGVALVSNGTFGSIQEHMRSWANATCLSFSGSIKLADRVSFTKPLLRANGTAGANSTVSARRLLPRADCRTIQVVSGDTCGSLASRCGISGHDFMTYNPGSSVCSTLMLMQHVCCSSGDLPDFRPKPNADGSCYSYETLSGDNCAALAAAHSLTIQILDDFNKKTWGWSGCNPLWLRVRMCLSPGHPPFPAAIENAVCGPQKPNTQPVTDGSDISKLNPCPLNACCNIWSQCGLTRDFCIDTNTGPPGTAAPGTFGCVSNCGMDIITGTGTGAIKIASYFQGYGLSRECLFQDAMQIDSSKYTHIHFGFGTLTTSYEVDVGDVLAKYEFERFKRVSGVKRILAFGGWTFSTAPETYFIFRKGVKPANRFTMAHNIASFIKTHNLDGVDIDWEYPGAPDIPGIPAGLPDEGPNYLAFLVVLKNLLPGKTVSIAAPASYHYLKQFPIQHISRIVDYIVFMTYDLHGQWDSTGSEHMMEGCKAGNCLRSHVNLTETR